MKSNSYSRATILTLVAVVAALVLASWPATGRSQYSSRRDRERYRRDSTPSPNSIKSGSTRSEGSTPSSPARSEPARPGTSEPAGRITKPAEPNVVLRPVERRPTRRIVQDEQWAKFEIITQRNMFSRLRVPFRPVEERPEPVRVMPNPESYLLLKGIVQEDNRFIAFVEDKQTGSVLRLGEGDPVARGTIKSLTLDALEYQWGDKTVTIGLGSDLEGGSGAITAGDLSSFAPAALPTGSSPPSAPSADEAEILKRLMQQRQQEMGK